MTLPSVAVLVVNYNGRPHLDACFSSLAAQDYPRDRLDIVLVDNASTDDSMAFTRARFPDVRIIRHDRNRGFAAAYHEAVPQIHTDYLAFLNNDTRVGSSWVRELADAADRHQAAVVGSTIVDWDGQRIDFAGGILTLTGHAWQVHHGEPVTGVALEERLLLFACAGAMLVERGAYEAAGGFDSDYFAYFEDVDLGWRLSVLGYRTVLSPRALTYHRLHGTSGKYAYSPRLRLYERNSLFTIFKNYEDQTLNCVLPVAIALTLARGLRHTGIDPRSFVFGAPLPERSQASPQTIATLIALEDVLRHLPRLRQKRAEIQIRRKRSDADLFPLFVDPLKIHEPSEEYVQLAHALYEEFGLHELVGARGQGSGTRKSGLGIRDKGLGIRDEGSGTKGPEHAREVQAASQVSRALRLESRGPEPEPKVSNSDPPPSRSALPPSLKLRRTAEALAEAGRRGSPKFAASDRSAANEGGRSLIPDPVISVVILTALGPTHLPECLPSLAALDFPRDQLEILIVDNGSAVDPTPVVRHIFPDERTARVLRLGENAGFCRGNNVGAREARGRWVFFLNDDTRLEPSCLRELLATAERRSTICVGARILDWIGERLDFGGASVNFEGRGFQVGYGSHDLAASSDERPILFGNGAGLLIRRDVFLEVGGFDEAMFAYYEDVALGWQLWIRGFDAWLSPKAIVYHKHHGTSARWPEPPRARLYERNALRAIFTRLETPTLERALPAALLLASVRLVQLCRLTERVASPLRRFYWRAKPQMVWHHTKAALAARGASRTRGLLANLQHMGLKRIVEAFWSTIMFVLFDPHSDVVRRSGYLIEQALQPASFDARQEPTSPHAAAVMLALSEWLGSISEQRVKRREIQADRKRSDREILRMFSDHWTDPVGVEQQAAYDEHHRAAVEAFGLKEVITGNENV